MTDFHRMIVSVPHQAMGVPKGGRVPRPFVFRTHVPIAIEVARDPAVAVLCRDDQGRETAYFGHGDALWLPITGGLHRGAPPLAAEVALRRLERGLAFDDLNACENPFLHVGAKRILPSFFVTQGTLEEEQLRSVASTDLEEVVPAAHRIAADFLLTQDGRLLRRSPGPFWGQYSDDALHMIPSTFGLPSGPEVFACSRLEEALEFRRAEYPEKSMRIRGTVRIHAPGCVPDNDAWIAARSLCRREFANWFGHVAPLATPEVAAIASQAAAGYERIHGLGIDVLTSKDRRNDPTPPSTVPPMPVQIAEAVDAMRAFVAQMPGPIGDDEVEGVCRQWRGAFEDISGRAIRRYDAFERHRLPDPEGVPEIDPVPSFAL